MEELLAALDTAIYDVEIHDCNDVELLRQVMMKCQMVYDACEDRLFEIEPEPIE
jgi:hypothetical protein